MESGRNDAALKQLLLGGLLIALPLLTYPLAIFPREIFEDLFTRRFDVVVPWARIGALTAALFVALKLWMGKTSLPVPRGWFVALALLGVAALLSVMGARHSGMTFNALADIFSALVLALAAMVWGQTARLRSLLSCCVVASAVATGFALMQWYSRDFKADVSLSAMMGNPNLLASYLVFSVPLVAGWVMQTRPAHPADGTKAAAKIVGGVVVMFGILIALRNTDSRAAWGALGVTAAIAAAGWLAMKNPKRAWLVALGFVVGSAMLLAATQFYWRKAFADDVRVEIWRGTIGLIRAHPVTGTGAGTFFAEYPPHRTAEYFAKPKAALFTDHAHNEWLETWAELGTLGALALLAVWLYAAHHWWHRRREMRAENWAFAVGAIALMAHGTFEVSLRHPPSQFLVWLALGLSLSGLPLPQWNLKLANMIRQGLAGAAVLACVAAAYFFVGKPLQSDLHWRQANVLLDAGKDGAESELSAAIDAQPFRVEALYKRAVLRERFLSGEQDEASRGTIERLIEDDLRRIKALAPFHRGVNRKLGLLYCRRGDFGRAIPYLETEVSLNTGTPAIAVIAAEFASDHLWLARAYLGSGRMSDAKESLKKAAQLDPNNESVKEMLRKLGE